MTCSKTRIKALLIIIFLLPCLLILGERSGWSGAPRPQQLDGQPQRSGQPQRGVQEIQFPEHAGYVNDFAGILSQQEIKTLTSFIQELQQKTKAEIAVVTLKSVAPYDINLYAVKLYEKWGIGVKGEDNGVLILLALKEREVRIEVGYGLEGRLPDGLAGEIIRKYMIPYFKQGDYGQGIMAGTKAVIFQVAREYQVKITGLPKKTMEAGSREARSGSSVLELLFTVLFFIFVFGWRTGLLGYFLFGPRRGGYWGGRGGGGFSGGFGGGGGFGGFGGGSSGGGGATGRW